jgi:hypothetical protein
MPYSRRSKLLLVGKAEVDAEFRIDETLNAILGNFVERCNFLRGKPDNCLVLIDSGGCDGFGENGTAPCNFLKLACELDGFGGTYCDS